jgi:hypothetical protein
MGNGGLGRTCVVFAALGALATSWAAAGAQALEPGVHVDPGSPAAKEYALPLSQARQTGSESTSQASAESTLFGAGIKPPGSGSPPRGGKGRAGAQESQGASVPAPSASSGSGAGQVLGELVLRDTRAHGSDNGNGSILALVGGGVAILVLGGFGGTVLRHSRRGPTPPSSA